MAAARVFVEGNIGFRPAASYAAGYEIIAIDKNESTSGSIVIGLAGVFGVAADQVEMNAGFQFRAFDERNVRACAGGDDVSLSRCVVEIVDGFGGDACCRERI